MDYFFLDFLVKAGAYSKSEFFLTLDEIYINVILLQTLS